MLKAVIFPQRGVELVLIGIKLFACHQFHKLVIAGALFVELRLDLLELVAHALGLFVERGAGLGLGALLLFLPSAGLGAAAGVSGWAALALVDLAAAGALSVDASAAARAARSSRL